MHGKVIIRKIYKVCIINSQILHDCISQSLRYFANKLRSFTKFVMLFPTVLFLNSKVRPKGARSIAKPYIINNFDLCKK